MLFTPLALYFSSVLYSGYCSSGKNKAAVFPVSSLPPDPAPTLAPPFENRHTVADCQLKGIAA